MANLNFHPAPGMGDLMAAWWVVPQNPLQMAQEGVSVKRTLGDFVDACFVVPQNPLRDYVGGTVAPIGQGVSGTPLRALAGFSGGCGGGCGGSCGCSGGMGDVSADFSKISSDFSAGNYGSVFTDTIFGIPAFIIAAAGIAILVMSRKSGTMRR